MISGVHGGHIHVFSEDATADFREGDLELARAEARRVGCSPPCTIKWCVLILPDVRDDNGDCWAVALMDIVTRHLTYVTLESADPDVTSRNLILTRQLLHEFPAKAAREWTETIEYGEKILRKDCGAWMCLFIQFLVEGNKIPSWNSINVEDCRRYLALSLLQNQCTAVKILLVERLGESLVPVEGTISSPDHSVYSESTIQDLQGGLSCANEDDHATPLYNMLSPSYHFHPVHNGRRPNQEANSHQDIRHIQCSGSDKLEIANVCRLPQDTILHRGDIYYGDVTVRDIIYLTEPAEITTNLLHYL
jgi:hypothetical protein